MGSMWLYLGAAVVAVYAGFGLVLLFTQSRLLYRPVRDVAFTPEDMGLDFEDVTFRTQDGLALNGWYVAAADAPFTILFCHGNAGNIMHRLDTVSLFHRLGLNCFVFDYRGYGRSEGRPTEAGTYRDARAAYEWLRQSRGIPAEQIVLFGRSLGGSVAAHLAAQVDARAAVVESAFTSYPDMGARIYPYMPVRLFARFRYNTAAHLAEARCPVLVMHSREDRLVPFKFGRRLFEAAPEPKRFVEIQGDHNDGYMTSGDLYKNAWIEWLDFVGDNRLEPAVRETS
ncbi:MAG TPA: alpha/beta hydrolase [Sedimentisphaerales bacterium]|nr:alpha/beta hydrolase [Sedimentisphaerales bacterium]HOH64514.1 alpha/beta hydrolase [Sedimentisphaerales bacterium]HPY49604.1 alpha/beta hydrolase [Sedimentisphaerales bacterium]HQN34064.1 alpha/beta hydrolase [Sedimentisphaerales bacterium]